MKKKMIILFYLLLTLGFSLYAKNEEFKYIPEAGLNKLLLEIKKLPVVGNIMYIGAHPDDENNSVMVYLNKGLHFNTSYLVANWGEGGQNEIGNELYDALGVIRSQELMAARAIDGAKQLYLGVYDFGYSISSQETLNIWKHDNTLENLVRIIRQERPDVIITNHDTITGHGHHQAIGILTLEAFTKAADLDYLSSQFSKEELLPWQVKKLYVASRKKEDNDLAINTGKYNSILGRSYAEVGAIARSSHKCQGMSRIGKKGDDISYFKLEKSVVGNVNENIMSGIDCSIKGITRGIPEDSSKEILHINKKLTELSNITQNIITEFDPYNISISAKPVSQAILLLREISRDVIKSDISNNNKNYLLRKLTDKEEDFINVFSDVHAVSVEIVSDDSDVYPGQTFKIQTTCWNRGSIPINNVKIDLNLPKNWNYSKAEKTSLINSENSFSAEFKVTVPDNIDSYTDSYTIPPIQAVIDWDSNNVSVKTSEYADVKVVPPVVVDISPEKSMIVKSDKDKIQTFSVVISNKFKKAINGTVKLTVPKNWITLTKNTSFSISGEDKESSVSIDVKIPANSSPGKYKLKAVAILDGIEYSEGFRIISYPHIDTKYMYKKPIAEIVVVDVKVADINVGYIDSGFDNVPAYLEMIGVQVKLISPEELSTGNLLKYDTIITGIRAYLSRDDLIANNDKLLKYVRNGGNLIVQFCKTHEWGQGYGPYQIELSSENVNDETAPVKILDPKSLILNFPNKITDRDWEGWFQQRAEWTPKAWSDKYRTVISTHDPGQKPREGLILITDYGKGTYIYTSAVWHLEMDKLVPGAYRIFANMISLSKNNKE